MKIPLCHTLLLISLVAIALSANIPVKVIYEDLHVNIAKRNLKESDTIETQIGVKNLEEKPQLSSAEIAQYEKIVTPDAASLVESVPGNNENLNEVYEKIEQIIFNGVEDIEKNVDQFNSTVKSDIIMKVNSTFEEFLENTRSVLFEKKVNVKQAPANQGWFQTVLTNFQNTTTNLLQNIGGQNQGSGSQSQSDETVSQSQNPFQVFANQIQGTFQQITNNLNQVTRPNNGTVLGDQPAPSNNPFQFVQNAIQQVQQVFTGNNNTQSDENSGNNPLQIIQNAGQQIVNVFRPTQAPGAASDDATTQGNNPFQFVQNAIQNVGQIFSPGSSGQNDESSTQRPSNPVQGFIQSAGQQIQQVFQGATGASSNPGAAAGSSPSNPIEGAPAQIASGVQNAGQQIIQAANNFVPGQQSSTAAPKVDLPEKDENIVKET